MCETEGREVETERDTDRGGVGRGETERKGERMGGRERERM